MTYLSSFPSLSTQFGLTANVGLHKKIKRGKLGKEKGKEEGKGKRKEKGKKKFFFWGVRIIRKERK